MNAKDDGKKKEDGSFADSKELFNRIFKQATQEIKLEKGENKQSPHVVSTPAPGRRQLQTKIPVTKKSAAPPAEPGPDKGETPQAAPKSMSERAESTPPQRGTAKPDKRNTKRSSALKGAALLILLAILAGTFSSYLGIIDISFLLNYFEPSREQRTQSPIRKKQPVRPSEKDVSSSQQPLEQVTRSSPAPGESTPSVLSKAEKFTELEKPTTPRQAKADKERVEEKATSVPTTNHPEPPDVAVVEEPQPVPVLTQPSAKPPVPEVMPPQARSPRYPYSVYLGSFKTSEAVNKALIEYQEKGLSPYWAKVDLGDKGVWFRFFAGYFQTKEEAEKFIRGRNIQGATPGTTKFANLIGIYSTDEEVEDNRRSLVSAGFYPYVIQGTGGKRFLYSGAFDRKEYAERERTILASKGIKSETIER